MLLRKPLLLLLLLFCCAKGFSATFVVTSNADSGPGTLRDALTQAAANGTAVKDYITFNLADQSEAGRTITISSQLPLVSSNLVIDGTTQPGQVFGVSNAKIILQPNSTSAIFDPFVLINVNGFELYGLYIRDFIGVAPFNVSAVLYVRQSDNIQIGASGKGNVISNNGYIFSSGVFAYYSGTVSSTYGINNLTVSANFFGFEPDGKTVRGSTLGYAGGIDFSNCKGNIIIGGDDISDRNIFGNGTMYLRESGSTSFSSLITIKNNYFSYDVNGNAVQTAEINAGEIYAISISNFNPSGNSIPSYSAIISDNKIQFPQQIDVGEIAGTISFTGNKLLFEGAASETTFSYGPGIGLWGDAGVFIGGEQPGEANILYGSQIRANSSKTILLHRNSIYCANINGSYDGAPTIPIYSTNNYQDPRLPVISIMSVTANSVSGTATPLSQIELFQDDDCYWCEPLTYFITVQADANGNWSYTGPISKGIIASATLNGYTSLFTTSAYLNSFKIVNSACGNNGAISGIDISNSGGYTITDATGKTISTNDGAKNLSPGIYTLKTNNLSCASAYNLTVYDATPVIVADGVQIIQPGCGNKNGSITGLGMSTSNSQVWENGYGGYSYIWKDAGGDIVSTSTDLTGVGPGTYTFQMTYIVSGCSATYGPITLKNTSGPNIDQSSMAVQSTNCGQSTGSITNINVTGTGTLKYNWTNSQQQVVATTKDLTGQPAGTYKLQVTDDTQCGPVYSADITIPETNGITMDETNAQPHQSSCGNGNGSVTGIQVTGATTYQWTDVNNKIVGNRPDLTNVVAGTYMLTASNATGCSKTSKTYTVIEKPATAYPAYSYNIVNTCPHYPTGSISITADNMVSAYHWVNSAGMPYGNTPEIDNLPADNYTLYLTDANGCESLYNTFKVTAVAQLAIVAGSETITDDQCGNSKGGITGVQVSGGTEPYVYRWTNASGTLIATTADLGNVQAGYYKLNVHDASNCGDASASYTVANDANIIPAPSVSNVQVCSSGSAIVSVNNASATGMYNLYDSESSTTPVDQQTGGKFKVDVNSNTSFYITQINGTCESNKAKVDVTVGLSALNIANTFTPNGDGINDYWKISNIENYPQAEVQVFTRYGQKVFESRGYQVPFDGTCKGQNLPAGVYYFIINLHSDCSLLSGSLTILR